GTIQRGLDYNPIQLGVGGGRIDNYGTWVFANLGSGYGAEAIDVPFFNYGTLQIDNPGNSGSDALRFSNLDNTGTLIVGPHLLIPKQIEVRGTYTQSAAATLRIQLSNSQPFSASPLYAGTFTIDNPTTLAGKLEVDFVSLDGRFYADHPTAGESYPLLSFASKTGDFSQKTSLDLANGYDYNFVYTATTITAIAKTAGQPQMAASLPLVAIQSAEPTAAQLASIFDAAITRWAAAGLTSVDLDRMRAADIHLADLSGNLLGLADGNSVTIDRDAAGWGWFIDSSPNDDDEFTLLAHDVFRARTKTSAEDH